MKNIVQNKFIISARKLCSGAFVDYLKKDEFPGGFHHNKCIFIHIPKAAGSTVCMDLFGYQVGHREYIKYWYDNPKKTNEYFKFTFVRNPWDRTVSAFHFLKKGGMDIRDKKWAEENISKYNSFDSFVKNWLNEDNIMKKNHFQPQLHFICHKNSKKIKVDYVGRVETLDQDMEYIKYKIGMNQKRKTYNKVNATERKNYREYYTNESADIVRRVYADDIEILGYSYES